MSGMGTPPNYIPTYDLPTQFDYQVAYICVDNFNEVSAAIIGSQVSK